MGGCFNKINRIVPSVIRQYNVCEFDPSDPESKDKLGQADIRSNFNELARYHKNISQTAKYNVFTFLPKALFYQFKKYTNIYFGLLLIPACFQVVAAYGLSSELPPFAFIIFVALLRELVEDIRRHQSDARFNSSNCRIVKYNKEYQKQWRDITIGDLVLLQSDERIPADMIIIGTSNQDGRCYMETSTLDGEKNLKPRERVKHDNNTTINIVLDDNKNFEVIAVNYHAFVTIPKPSYVLYDFEGGYSEYYDLTNTLIPTKVGLEVKNLLFKGAKIKNTSWVLGMVVYTGKDTKIQQNATTAKSKTSAMERRLHKVVIAIFFGQLILAFFTAFGKQLLLLLGEFDFNMAKFLVFVGDTLQSAEYTDTIGSNFIDGFRYFLLLTTLIPISLLVNLEVVRLFQALFLSVNYELYNPTRDIHCRVNTSSVNEELGEIEYVLSDKTGTLTQNKMVLEGLFIGEGLFGGTFKTGDKGQIIGFESNLEKNKRLMVSYDEKFDSNLHNIINATKVVPLWPIIPLSTSVTCETDLKTLKAMNGSPMSNSSKIPPNPELIAEVEDENDPREHESERGASYRGTLLHNPSMAELSVHEANFDGVQHPGYMGEIELSEDGQSHSYIIGATPKNIDQTLPLNGNNQGQQTKVQNPHLAPRTFNFNKNPQNNNAFGQLDDKSEYNDRISPDTITHTIQYYENESEFMQESNMITPTNKFSNFHLANSPPEGSVKNIGGSPRESSMHEKANSRLSPDHPPPALNKGQRSKSHVELFTRNRSRGMSYNDSPPHIPYPHYFKSYQELISEFLLCASLCHDCVVEMNAEQQYSYQGPSPDEIAICRGSRDIGSIFKGRNSDGKAEVDIFGKTRYFQIKMVSSIN